MCKIVVIDTKLTLKLDPSIIKKAKLYTSEKKVSLFRLIENYLNSLTSENSKNELQIPPFVKSLTSGVKIPVDYDYKKDRADYLEQKYK